MAATAGLLLLCAGAAPRADRQQRAEPAPPPPEAGRWTLRDARPSAGATAGDDTRPGSADGLGTPRTPPSDAASLTDVAGTEVPAATERPASGDEPSITLTGAQRGIPDRLLSAYQQASARLAREQPGCHLSWELLAAIGKIESGHAVGRPMTADGTVTRPILGPALDGQGGRALIRDSDDGALDGDTTLDRAVGPMQFIPTTWRTSGRDGSSDGRKDPHNIHDATLAAGGYLCAHGRDLDRPGQLRAAIYAYNPSAAAGARRRSHGVRPPAGTCRRAGAGHVRDEPGTGRDGSGDGNPDDTGRGVGTTFGGNGSRGGRALGARSRALRPGDAGTSPLHDTHIHDTDIHRSHIPSARPGGTHVDGTGGVWRDGLASGVVRFPTRGAPATERAVTLRSGTDTAVDGSRCS